MKLRALLIGPLLAASSLDSAPAASADAPAAAAARPNAGALPRFRFDAGARLLAPAGVASDGSVCVGTVDGYVHALNADGSYRWSHTVRGSITRRPIFAGERWHIASNDDRIYALQPRDGALSWVFKPPSALSSELVADADGALYFVAADRFLYRVSAQGGVSLRAAFGELKAGPSAARDGAIWAENQAGVRLRVRGLEVRRFPADAARELEFPDPELLVDPEGRTWRGRQSGELELVERAGEPPSVLPVASSPLFAPAWSWPERSAVVSTRSGLVLAFAPVPSGQGR